MRGPCVTASQTTQNNKPKLTGRCCTSVVVEEKRPHMIVKRFGCTAIHNKVLYKCLFHSFIQSFIHNDITVPSGRTLLGAVHTTFSAKNGKLFMCLPTMPTRPAHYRLLVNRTTPPFSSHRNINKGSHRNPR